MLCSAQGAPICQFALGGVIDPDPVPTQRQDQTRYSARWLVKENKKMKTMILAAVAALILTAGVAQTAHAFPGEPQVARHSGPYDNTANSLGGRYVGSN
jgi:hypothetical protein